MGVLFGVAFLFQGCDDTPETTINNSDIPSDFNYVTVKTIDLTVNVNDKFNGQYFYKIEVYDQNPYITDTVVNLLAAGVGNQSKTFSTRVVIPQFVNSLFVRQTDPTGKSVVKVLSVQELQQNGKAQLSFVPSNAKSAGPMKVAPMKAAPVQNNKATDYVLPATYTTISGNGVTINSSGAFYIADGTTVTDPTISYQSNTEVYVKGNLIFDKKEPNLAPGFKLVLLPGSTVTVSTKKDLTFGQGNSVLAIYEGATMTISQGLSIGSTGTMLVNDGNLSVVNNLEILNNGSVVNNGTIVAAGFNLTNNTLVTNNGVFDLSNNFSMNSNTTLVNNGTLEADNTFTSNNLTAFVYNYHVIKTGYFNYLNGGGILYNYCRIEAEDMGAGSLSVINNADGAMIQCQDVELNGVTFNLEGGSIFRAIDLGYNNVNEVKKSGVEFGYNVTINGTLVNDVQPVFIAWKLANPNGWKVLDLTGNLEFVVYPGTAPGANFFKTTLGADVELSESPSSVVPSSDCNLGGLNNSGGGGVPPVDPTFPIEMVEGTDYIYSMEDLWPHMGDYDMNDFVFKIHAITKYINSSNLVEKMTFQLTPMAAGSTKRITAALQLDGVPAGSISLVSTGDVGRSEADQTKANFILFENIHVLFGIDPDTFAIVNTYNKIAKTATSTYSFELTFATPVSQESVSVDKLNFYTIIGDINSNDRKEIHLGGYAPSDKVAKATNNYKDTNNMVWALMLPSSAYKYPVERVKISDAYPNFDNWAKSGGTENTDWYLHPSETANMVYTK